jgi:hypothetical protein
MNVKSSVVEGKEPVGLVSSVVFSAETPVNVWKNGLVPEA